MDKDRLHQMPIEEKRALLKKMLRANRDSAGSDSAEDREPIPGLLESREYESFRIRKKAVKQWGAENLYFRETEGISKHRVSVGGREVINFSSYNYLGLSGHPEVQRAAKAAIDTYGTSVSASRIASGEKAVHRSLERAIADFLGTQDALVMVGGFATNESTIGHLMGERDLVLYDSCIHESIQRGSRLSGATIRAFPHNRWESLETILSNERHRHEKSLIVIEGVYSMDGDFPDLREFVRLKTKYRSMLMVDEAHSLGVMGATGRGIGEHSGLDPAEVDIWMGTLSKSLASCGGYLAGSADWIDYLRYTVPGFVFSVGLPPASSAAAEEALRILAAEPERVSGLRRNSDYLREAFRSRGWNVGPSRESAVVPLVLGESSRCVRIARDLLSRGVLVMPIIYPAVPEESARLRFFVSSDHTRFELESAVDAVESCLESAGNSL